MTSLLQYTQFSLSHTHSPFIYRPSKGTVIFSVILLTRPLSELVKWLSFPKQWQQRLHKIRSAIGALHGLLHIIPKISFYQIKKLKYREANKLLRITHHTTKCWCEDLIPGILSTWPVLGATSFCWQNKECCPY